jgi:hypothetical protein
VHTQNVRVNSGANASRAGERLARGDVLVVRLRDHARARLRTLVATLNPQTE